MTEVTAETTEVKTAKEPEYVVVNDPETGEPVELPTNAEDGSLSMVTLEHAFPAAHGLKYKNPTTGASRALLLDSSGTKFLPPAGGWAEKTFNVVLKKVTPGDETEQQTKKRKKNNDGDGDSDETSGDESVEKKKKSKRHNSDDKAICSDLIVLGLPYKLTDQEMKEYFEQFGTVILSEIKKNEKGDSRGFGFIQMAQYEEQIRVLSKPNHLIGGRKCQVRMPLSKNGEVREPNLALNPKLFVSRVPEGTTAERLNEYFTEHAHKIDQQTSVLDVYIPKPFRGFAFVTFSSPYVAKELIRQGDFIIDGSSIAVTAAAPRESFPKNRQAPFGGTPGRPHIDGRAGPRNGPVSGYERYDDGSAAHYGGGAPGGGQRYDWRDQRNAQPPSSRYYEGDRSRQMASGYGDDLEDQNSTITMGDVFSKSSTFLVAARAAMDPSGGGMISGMSSEVVTAAFKAFLTAAQQTISGGGNGSGGNTRNGSGAAAYGEEISGFENNGAGMPEWR